MPDHKEHLEQLAQAIRQLHQCECSHLETVQVSEAFRGKIVWEGPVEVFEISNHPKARRCYAWSYWDKQTSQQRIAAILGIRLIPSALDAVKAFIMAQNKKHLS